MLEDRFGSLTIDSSASSNPTKPHGIMLTDVRNRKDLVDVSHIFKDLGDKLKADTIIKNPEFDLFEGTRSLEVDNIKLDSSLIPLSEIEFQFNCNEVIGEVENKKLQIDNITAISDRLLRSIICWLNDYQTLPTTVLSCRYVEYILSQSEAFKELSILSTGDELYDKVLNTIVIGVCYFAKFVLDLLKSGVIMEEEDLNFNSMGLNFLSFIHSSEEIINMIEESLQILNLLDNFDTTRLIFIVKMVKCLIHIEETLTEYSAETTSLELLVTLTEKLNSFGPVTHPVPAGCFSMGIQRRLANQFPPRNLVIPGNNYLGYQEMAEDIIKVLKVSESETALETLQFASLFNHIKQKHVIARALFSLFFMRNDQNIIGKYTLNEFIFMHLNEFSLTSTKSTLSLLPPEMSMNTEPVLQEAIRVTLEMYQNTAQNTCRVRQGYNRQLLLWDSLQAQMENLEFEFENYSIVDIIDEESGSRYMPYCSWVYMTKMTVMIEFVLKGFALDVYKPFESYTMFWYAYYLTHKLEFCLNSVQQFIEHKIKSIHTVNKRIKKLKAGEKKESLRLQYREAMNNEMPQLQINNRYLNFLLMKNTITKSLCLTQLFQFGILKSFGVIDNKSPSKSAFINNKLIHDLRFKPFASIGIPELPSYDLFEKSLDDYIITEPMISMKSSKTVEYMEIELKKTTEKIDQIIQCIQAGDSNGVLVTGTRLIKDEALEYYEQLKKTAECIAINAKVINKKFGSQSFEKNSDKYLVELKYSAGSSTYYPLLSIVEKKLK